MKKLSFKKDRFKKNRGGYFRWLLLSCEKCGDKIFIYQKDGPGILKRIYLDRILNNKKSSNNKNLVCGKCKTILGVPIIYKKENRPAVGLFSGAIAKEIIKENELSKINF